MFLLDDRYHRDPPATPDGTMLGETQLAWLLDGLSTSTATFKIVASGSQWTPSAGDDSWSDFQAERDAILDHIAPEPVAPPPREHQPRAVVRPHAEGS